MQIRRFRRSANAERRAAKMPHDLDNNTIALSSNGSSLD